jgi:superfamily II DNA helicase RecQ
MPLVSLLLAHTKFFHRPLQREVVTATLEGEDVFLQAATSFGKSLCYQLPAVVDFGSAFKRVRVVIITNLASHYRDISTVSTDGMSFTVLY